MKQQVCYIRQVLRYKLWNMRTLAFCIIQLAALYSYLGPIRKFSADMEYPAAPWCFPFLISDLYFLFLFLLGIVYYFSDVPFMQYQNMYQVIRTGRKKWALGQIAAVCIQSFLVILFEMGASMLFLAGHLEWTTGWGKLFHTIAVNGMPKRYHPLFGISYEATQIFTPFSFMAVTLLVCGLVLCLIGLIMFAVSLFAGRMAAVAAATAMTVMIYFVENAHPLLTRKIAMFVPASWMRVSHLGVRAYGNYLLPPLNFILAFLVIGILLLGVVIVKKIDTVEFEWVKED